MNPYFAALLSATAMGAVYLIDRAMVGNTYTRPSQPMLVSSIGSFLPVPVLLLLGWQMPSLEAAVLGVVAGLVLMLANWLYFTVIFSKAGDCTEVAAFENSSILVIAVVAFLLHQLGLALPDSILPRQWVGVGTGAAALIGLSVWGDRMEHVTLAHRVRLILFMLFGAGYEILTDFSIHISGIEDKMTAYVAVSPFFWTGLSTGVVAVLPRKEWSALKENYGKIVSCWKAIAVAELCAVVAFAAMIFGFAEAHVAVVAMLAGSFPILVLIGGVVLRRKFGFSAESFHVIRHPKKKTIMMILVILSAALASWH